MSDEVDRNSGAAEFIARWQGADGTELANYQLFVHHMADLLGVPHPEPAREDTRDNAYVFERRVTLARGDGTTSEGRIDCYRRGAFVLEAKKIRAGVQSRGFDDAMLRARAQAENYARALPATEGRPPFLLVVDVGNVIELYSEFTRSGSTYTPFPDPRSHRIRLPDLAVPAVRERLTAVWMDPMSLDPTRESARVTRHIAANLADVARALESEHSPQTVAGFLSRCLFTMFAEDVGLLPKRSFADLLIRHRSRPDVLARQLEVLWANMDGGEFSPLLETTLLHFNGKLFKDRTALQLSGPQIDLLALAAVADWKQVEPAIFGTLLERALDPDERHRLGAHYTPRAYVERLVLATVIEPLRNDWANVQAESLVLARDARQADGRDDPKKMELARAPVRDFLRRLCEVRVLDPACGSGNFLYVALEQMKRLEGEVLNFLDELGDTQGRLDLAGVSVDPHQLLGIELNPRAAAVAEMVLWIGYLQWHYRTRGNVNPPLPVLKDFKNIECRDAVLEYGRVGHEIDAHGKTVTRWDGRSMKKHPVTGIDVPDERAQVPVEKYSSPQAAAWPTADFVVGNPPFVGNKRMRFALGDGYVEALRKSRPTVPEAADLVMYWWDHAAELTRAGKLRRFGLITTNSVRQTFNRKVVERHLSEKPSLSLTFAIPDHPWVDSADGADVRIAMTAGGVTADDGLLLTVERETPGKDGENEVQFGRPRRGCINADLTIGAAFARAVPLRANALISNRGVIPHGEGFFLSPGEAADLVAREPQIEQRLREYRNGRDIASLPRGFRVLDLFGLSAREAREQFPVAYQHLLERVKPERDQNPRKSRRENWWIFAENQPAMRRSLQGLSRYIATIQTARHRFFVFLDGNVLPDDKLIVVGSESAELLGVLSSRIHVVWALSARARLGIGNDPVYNKTECFERFPFPVLGGAHTATIGDLAEQIDAHRKRVQSRHPKLKLTGVYNVVEKLRRGEQLTAQERTIHDDGLASVLRDLHDDLDRAALDAYGWTDLAEGLVGRAGATIPWPEKPAEQSAAEEELLSRLLKLNFERAAEEGRGLVRWLRPQFQASAEAEPASEQAEIEVGDEATQTALGKPAGKQAPWPSTLPAQIRLVADTVAQATRPLELEHLAEQFTGRGAWKKRLSAIVESLVALGRVKVDRRDDRVLLHP